MLCGFSMTPLPRALLLALVVACLPACRLPLRHAQWAPVGGCGTWLPNLTERRSGRLTVSLWIDDRARWRLPYAGALLRRPEKVFVLIVISSEGKGGAAFDPARVRLNSRGFSDTTPRAAGGCTRSAPPGGRAACGFELRLPRGAYAFELDLSNAIEPFAGPIVFRAHRSDTWVWRKVGPAVPWP